MKMTPILEMRKPSPSESHVRGHTAGRVWSWNPVGPGPAPPLAPWHEGSQFLMFQRQTTLSRRLPTFQRLLPLAGTGLFFLVARSTLHSPQALVPWTGALEHGQGCLWFLSLPEPVKAFVPCEAHGAELTRHRKARSSFLSMPSFLSKVVLSHSSYSPSGSQQL